MVTYNNGNPEGEIKLITVSERASKKLKDILMERFLNMGLGFRVIVNDAESGCKTLGIKLDSQCAGDEVIDLYGIKLLLDTRIKELLGDCELDYINESVGGFLVRTNNCQEPRKREVICK